MKREIGDGFELDDDRDRIDVAAVHRFLTESYWARGRELAVQEQLVREATRVVGLYHANDQIGFCRAVSVSPSMAYLADVYVLEAYRGRGLGRELINEMIDAGHLAGNRWLLHTRDAHALYSKHGFTAPSDRVMERQAPK